MLPEDHHYIMQEIDDIRAQNTIAQPPPGVKHSKKYYLQRLFQKGTRNRIGIGLLLMAFQNLTGGVLSLMHRSVKHANHISQ